MNSMEQRLQGKISPNPPYRASVETLRSGKPEAFHDGVGCDEDQDTVTTQPSSLVSTKIFSEFPFPRA